MSPFDFWHGPCNSRKARVKLWSLLKWPLLLVAGVLIFLVGCLVAVIVTPITTVFVFVVAIVFVAYLVFEELRLAVQTTKVLLGRTGFMLVSFHRRPRLTLKSLGSQRVRKAIKAALVQETKALFQLPLMLLGAALLLLSGWIGMTFAMVIFLTFAAVGYFVQETAFLAFALALLTGVVWHFLPSLRRRPRLTLRALGNRRLWGDIKNALGSGSKEAEQRFALFLGGVDTVLGNRGD